MSVLMRQFGQYDFTHITLIHPERDVDGAIIRFLPQSQYLNRRNLALHIYGEGPFCSFRIPKTYATSGVYIFTLDDEPYYVGECVNLSRRFNTGYGLISPRNCFQGGQSTNCRINNLVYQACVDGSQLDLWFYETKDYKRVEAELIALLQTREKWNRKD